MSVNLRSLFAKLNSTARETLNNAAGLGMSRTHYEIEMEHWLIKTLEGSDHDVAAVLNYYGVDKGRLAADLQRALENLKTGNVRPPAFSPALVKTMSDAWTIGSLEYNAGSVRTGFMLLALLSDADLVRLVNETTRELKRIEPEGLRKDFYAIVAASIEVQENLSTNGMRHDGAKGDEAPESKAEALLTDEELARLAKALIRELMPKESSGETRWTRDEVGLHPGPGS